MARKKPLDVRPYLSSDYGKKEEELHRLFQIQMEDARLYFTNIIKPRLDRSYKLYIAYTGDRQREIQKWQANIFVPYVQAVVETLMPRVLDARPEFSVVGRTPEDMEKGEKQQQLCDYYWEISKMDQTNEDLVRSAMIYGTGFLQVGWKKDVRTLRFLRSKDMSAKKFEWKEEERVFYDAPYAEWVDNYSLWYDWHNIKRSSKQYWFKRLVLTKNEIERNYPNADKVRLQQAYNTGSGDLTNYAAIRDSVKLTHERITRGASGSSVSQSTSEENKFYDAEAANIQMFEVFEWWRPFDDEYTVVVGGGYVPILKGGSMPNPYDFKESPFIETTYLRVPGEFEGYGFPMILENPQIMLNLIKNQRLDSTTLSIHKMWIVNPLANIDKTQLVTRPFGIIYSVDPNGVREVQFSDIKSSAYREEEMLKGDMRYSSGVDDFSMGVGGGAGSATEVRHLRESTLERVRLFVNHLGDTYSDVMRYWIDMTRQLMTKAMTIRVIGESGETLFPIVERDDLTGMFDYKARVLPSIAGMQDISRKQAMDLFQLLSNIDPATTGVDIKKLITKLISNWGWSLDSIATDESEEMPGDPSDPAVAEAMGMDGVQPGQPGMPQPGMPPAPQDDMSQVLSLLRSPEELAQLSGGMGEASQPINLLQKQGPPPTPPGAAGAGGPGKRQNPAGFNRTGKVNTNISRGNNATPEGTTMNQVINTQR